MNRAWDVAHAQPRSSKGKTGNWTLGRMQARLGWSNIRGRCLPSVESPLALKSRLSPLLSPMPGMSKSLLPPSTESPKPGMPKSLSPLSPKRLLSPLSLSPKNSSFLPNQLPGLRRRRSLAVNVSPSPMSSTEACAKSVETATKNEEVKFVSKMFMFHQTLGAMTPAVWKGWLGFRISRLQHTIPADRST